MEGHVPAVAIRELLDAKPVAIGLAFPACPQDRPE